MSSIIEGYSFDIFISYRQKDNKYDGWVTEFVDNLKKEIEATFKEEISVYFDINPHDGLLETHDVDASLKEKLKCLVFIPIISRTYCDPKSFAWTHEFKFFIEQASHDQFGLKIKLSNGNVANRVLPVRIHDLENDDIKLCESILGGVLRSIDFIYKEPGVNRSLTSKDHEERNLNSTNYRNQINKVALAVKEIILGIKNKPAQIVKELNQTKFSNDEEVMEEKRSELSRTSILTINKSLSILAIAVILILAGIFLFPKIFKHDKLNRLRSLDGGISVAVMPFQNMTNDSTWNVWQDGIQVNLITSLSNNPEELKVRQTESINSILKSKGINNYASITPSVASTISQKLDAKVLIYGSINQSGSTIRLNAQLVDSKTENVLKSFQIDGTTEKILLTIDSLSRIIKDFLLLTKLRKETSPDAMNYIITNSPEAYKYYIYGRNAFYKRDYTIALNWFSQTIAIDSNFTFASVMMCLAYSSLGMTNQARINAHNVYMKRDKLPMQQKLIANWLYAVYYETYHEENKYLMQYLEFDDQAASIYYMLGLNYNGLHQYDKAITYFEKALEIFEKWDMKPPWVSNYTNLGLAYHKTGQYRKEKTLYKKAEQEFPEDPYLISRQAIMALAKGDTKSANRYIEKWTSVVKGQSWSEARISRNLGDLYNEVDYLDLAEKHYRQALLLESENPERMSVLAYFLIEKDRNINEGMMLIDTLLKNNTDNFEYLHFKGWGFYKEKKYQEALVILQKSWDLRMKTSLYDHDAFLHLEAVKKAVAGQK